MKKFTIFIMVFIIISILAYAKTNIIELDDSIMKPEQIIVGNKNIYITEGTTINIFSKNAIKLIGKFGKKGEGPGEIQGSRRGGIRFTLIPLKDKIYLFNRNKVMYFSKNGKFLNEMRIPSGFVRSLFPIKDKYIGRTFKRGKNRSFKTAISIFSNDLKKKKLFYGSEKSSAMGSRFKHFMSENIFNLKTAKGMVFINDTVKFLIKVFDINGKKLRDIKYNYSPQKVSEKTKKDIRNYYKTSSRFKAFYDRFKNRIEFGKTYNAIRDFFIDNDKIYVQTYDMKGENTKFLIFDIEGKFIKKVFLPLEKVNILEFYPYNFKDGKLYQIVENEDEEIWELHIVNI